MFSTRYFVVFANRTDKPAQRKKPNNYVAGAQQLPSANISPVVLSEQRTQVLRTFNLNPDCSAVDVIVAKVTKAGKGQVEFEATWDSAPTHKIRKSISATFSRPLGFQYFIRHQQGSRGLIVLKWSFSTDVVQVERRASASGSSDRGLPC